MMKGKELKQRMAALLIATMTLGGMATPVLADPLPAERTSGITREDSVNWGSEGYVTLFCVNGNDATIYEADGKTMMKLEDSGETVELVPASGSNAKRVAVYAGRLDNTEVTEPVVLTMESGSVDYLFGGSAAVGKAGFKLHESTINLKGGTVVDVMANRPNQYGDFSKCQESLVDSCTINLSGGTVKGQLGGTFGYSQVNTLTVNVSGGEVKNRLVLAGTNGRVEYAKLSVTGGKVAHISSGLRALVDEAKISVTGGKVNEIFAGSHYPDEETSAGTDNWKGWSMGHVNYGLVRDLEITISGDADYNGVYGGFQYGIKAASSSDADKTEAQVFYETYKESIPEAIKDAYQYETPTTTVINYSVDPTTDPGYQYTKNLLTDKENGVTVNDYRGAELNISGISSGMKLGEEKELTADITGIASPSDAEYAWESSDEEILSLTPAGGDTVTLTAKAPGEASVTVDYSGILKKSFNVTVAEPQLKLSLPSSMNYADEEVYLKARVENIADDLEVTYTASVDKPGLEAEEGDDDGEFRMVPQFGLSGDYKITVEAELDALEYSFKGNKSLKVKDAKLTLTTAEGSSKTLDVKGAETAVLEVISDYDEYDSYEWMLEGDAVELETAPDGTSGTVTAVKEGPATILVEAVREAAEVDGPSSRVEIPEVRARAEIRLTVTDTREFKAEKRYIELDINPEAAKLSDTVKITNDYEAEPAVEVVDSTQPVTANLQDGILTVSTTAKETGSATVVLTLENGMSIRIPVIIKTTAIVAEVTNGIEVTVKDDAVAPAQVKTEGLEAEQAEAAQKQAAEQTTSIKNAITDAFTRVAQEEEVAEVLASNASGMSAVAMKYTTDNGLKVENGDIVKVYPKQELKNVALDSKVLVNAETGEVTTVITIKKMTFDISLQLDKLNDKNEPVAGGTLNIPKTNKEPITFSVPLPGEGIASEARYVKVTHAGDVKYFTIQEDKGVKYTVITTYHFSPFELEFVENLPAEPHRNSRSGGGSYGTGQWIQNETGWQYKTASGTRLVNCWKQLIWNNQMQWYHFDTAGYMTAGWFTDTDQNRYFLHNISDGNQGRMYTGWNQIEGKWHYFRANAGGPQGSLLVDGMTPDGYRTDLSGACAAYKPQ